MSEDRPVIKYKPGPDDRRNPPASSLKVLSQEVLDVIEAMVHGIDEPYHGTIRGEPYTNEAGTPLTFKEAALAKGVSVSRIRELTKTELFVKALNAETAALRNAQRPRNLHTAIAIRDDPGDQSAATKTVRLKAIDSIEGKSSSGSTVNVNVQQNNIAPGYVIRLPAKTVANDDDTKTIDASPNQESDK
jgi:hypothetical protein